MSRPLTNVAHSTLLVPPPNSVAGRSLWTRRAQRLATAYASASMAPTAVANESMTRRLASWTTSAGRSSNRSFVAYRANRSASVRAIVTSLVINEKAHPRWVSLKRDTGVEPVSQPWEGWAQPIYQSRDTENVATPPAECNGRAVLAPGRAMTDEELRILLDQVHVGQIGVDQAA